MKRVCAALLVLIMALTVSLTGCSGSGEPDTTLEAILEEMETAFALDASSRMSEDDLLDFYGIQSADISEQASLSAMNGIFPDEIIMIKAKDETALARIQEKLANRLQEVLNQSKSYDAASYAVVQKCKVDVRGLYIALFVSPNHEKMTELYSAHF